MQTRVKSASEIAAMRESGRMLALVLKVVCAQVTPGVSTKELAEVAASELKALGGSSSFLGHEGYPDVICISVNDEIVHGLPNPKRLLGEGDIVGVDFGVRYKGMITDSAVSLIVGKARKPQHTKLVRDTERALYAGIDVVRNGVRTGTIGATIEAQLRPQGYGIPYDLVGHGVGDHLWEEPNIPNYGRANTGSVLRSGMTIAIEPMVTLGSSDIELADDGFTLKTADGSLAAHFEHTVLILDEGAEILTRE